MATRKFTDPWLRGFRADLGQRVEWLDEAETGLAARANDKGRVTFLLVARFPNEEGNIGNVGRKVLGDYKPDDDKGRAKPTKRGVETLTLEGARAKARRWKEMLRSGEFGKKPISGPMPLTFREVADEFMKRHARRDGQTDGQGNPKPALRSAGEMQRILDKYVLPAGEDADTGQLAWRDRPFEAIRRGDITALLDQIEDRGAPVMADRVLALLSKLCNWHATRVDDYTSPIKKGMRRTAPEDRVRSRVLGLDEKGKWTRDWEIRAFWEACGGQGAFGDFCKIALLTGQRRAKVAEMRWDDIGDDGVWRIDFQAREKANAQTLKLAPMALAIIRARTPEKDNPYVFAGRAKGKPIGAFSKPKAALDAAMVKIAEQPIAPWTVHDLRRTAKSLLSRCGVPPYVSERVLGHAIGGVEAVYERHDWDAEKADALARLAQLVAQIVKPPEDSAAQSRDADEDRLAEDNVVPLRRKAKR